METNSNQEVKVGDIFDSCWGYEANLVDFCKIVKITPASVKYVELSKVQAPGTGGDYWTTGVQMIPVPNSMVGSGKVYTAKIRRNSFGDVCFSNKIGNGIFFRWDGKPVHSYNNH